MCALKDMSNTELVNQLKKLVLQEQNLTIKILPHLIEVEKRELYLELAYNTLTEYCIHELGYGESSAWRRVRVAHVIKRIPNVYELLVARKLTFSAVLQVANVLTPDNRAELLPRLSGASKSRIDRIIAEYQKPQRIPDTARPRVVVKEIRTQASPSLITPTVAGGRESRLWRKKQSWSSRRCSRFVLLRTTNSWSLSSGCVRTCRTSFPEARTFWIFSNMR